MNRHVSPMLAGATTVGGVPFAPSDRRTHATSPAAVRPVAFSPPAGRVSVRDRTCMAYRINVAARVFSASFGAYAVAAALAALLVRLLPMARPEAVMTGTLAALLIFPAVTIAAFLVRSPARALGGVITITAVLATLAMMLPLPPA